MRPILTILAALAFLPSVALAQSQACYPEVKQDVRQFIIGYGSLMETASRVRSSPTAGVGHPVHVTGFQRAWNARGDATGFSTTYLGALVAEDASTEMVAVLYEDPDASDITGTDEREVFYCRYSVPHGQIQMLDGWALPADAQVWIYALRPEDSHLPDARWPIVQSYVDVFINGCFQLTQLLLPETAKSLDFPSACIHTTAGWSEHWVNDRIYPRRAHILNPVTRRIDDLLDRELPDYFGKITLE